MWTYTSIYNVLNALIWAQDGSNTRPGQFEIERTESLAAGSIFYCLFIALY